MRTGWLTGLVATAGLVATGCAGDTGDDPGLGRQVGKNCTVQFRRDALGAGAALPVPPTTGEINGASVRIYGKLVRATRGWITLADGDAEYTIPRESVLLIEVRSK